MMKYLLYAVLMLFTVLGVGQNKNYCDWEGCSLSPDHEAHFDPYYNGHLCENFNPRQTDFSEEYLKLQTKKVTKVAECVTPMVKDYSFNLESIFNTPNRSQNGIIGLDYKRLRMHISKAEKHVNSTNVYVVYGKSNVNGTICDFKGLVKIIEVYEVGEGRDYNGQGQLFASYEIYENENQKNSGCFKGTFECSVLIDHEKRSIKIDESFGIADGYYNRTYVGIWKSYKTDKKKKCIWGDHRLPFTFDFDCGDGEMRVCDKYVANGWLSFNDGSDFKIINRWWEKE